jgi:hypothetical protein
VCDAAIQRVSNCLLNHAGLPPLFDVNAQPPFPFWSWQENQYSPCCSLAPLVTSLCRGRDIVNAIQARAAQLTVSGGDCTPVKNALTSQIDSCQPGYIGAWKCCVFCDSLVLWLGNDVFLLGQITQRTSATRLWCMATTFTTTILSPRTARPLPTRTRTVPPSR